MPLSAIIRRRAHGWTLSIDLLETVGGAGRIGTDIIVRVKFNWYRSMSAVPRTDRGMAAV